MISNKNGIIRNEIGAFFVFGPLWFVILIMIIGFIFSALKNNNSNNNNHNNEMIEDYNPYNTLNSSLESNICSKCGIKNNPSAKFCIGCGSNLSD